MPVIRISDELFKEIQKYADPLVDNFESAVWKVLKLVGNNDLKLPEKYTSRAPGKLTPPKDFWRPILETLVERGGQEYAQEVVKSVERKMKSQLKPGDFESNLDGSSKWEKQVNFQRLKMVHEGLLARNSPRGIWQITEQGKQRFADQTR